MSDARQHVPEDTHLVRRAQRGDRTAFECLYRRHVGRVYAVCLRLCGEERHADELVQDVFIRAWQGLRRFRGDAAFSSWLHRLAVNAVYTDARGRRRRESRVAVRSEEALPDTPMQAGDPGLRLDLEQAISKLPPMARGVFVLHDVEGYTHEEIGDVMGIATGTAKAHLHRARRLLRVMLDR